ncbi:MAG: TonB-dependent receptor [Bacteroidia bacterium]|nr:TonB-dependent receptor [Bacteroidia bacterium]
MMKIKELLLFTAFFFALTSIFAQGTIRGRVTDGDNGEAMIGATVRIFQDSTLRGGAYTDLEGNFNIANVAAGKYRLVISYLNYLTLEVQNIEVKTGDIYSRDFIMNPDLGDEGEQNTVVLTAKVDNSTENRMLVVQRRSVNVVDGISNQQLRRTGDSDAGAAVRRIVGLTVEDGKYIYVRGLGDRYNKGFLNGAEIPGLDPERNTIQMDLFPTSLIDNLTVYKTFTPDLPASFTGGLVNIETRDFPDKFTVRYSTTLGFNTQASLRNNLALDQGSSLDWLGMDDGTRAFPAVINQGKVPSLSFSDPEVAATLDAASKSLTTPVNPVQKNSFLNQSHNFSIGNQWLVGGDKPLGFIANVSYRLRENYFDRGTEGRYHAIYDSAAHDITLIEDRNLNKIEGSREVLLGGMAKVSFKPSPNHKLSLNYLRNQSGESFAKYLEGGIPEDDPSLTFQTRTVGYLQRSINVMQAQGDHLFANANNFKIDWIGSYSISRQETPDLRFFSNDYHVLNGDTIYQLQPALYNNPSRFYRDLQENNLDSRVNFELPFNQWKGLESKLKFGGAYTMRDRFFRERRLEIVNVSGNINYNGDPADYLSQENMGVIGTTQTPSGTIYNYGNVVNDATQARNNYDGSQKIMAAYAMTILPVTPKLKTILGARYEGTFIHVASLDRQLAAAEIVAHDVLPSVNLIYSPRENMNIRASVTRTIGRPFFRELAPFASFDFVGDYALVGNPNLTRTLVDNLDLRWEMYPRSMEIFSFSAFYKNFTNPIERVVAPSAANTELNLRNVDNAKLYGIEVEFKKGLDFIHPKLANFRVGGNMSLIHSAYTIDPSELYAIRETDPSAKDTRPMFGQSPFTVNAEMSYTNDTLGLTSSLVFNVFGPRIAAVGSKGTPNIYEIPRNSLDFYVSKSLGEYWSLTFRAQNLLNPAFKRVYRRDGLPDVTFSESKRGQIFSLGFAYKIP